MASKPALRQRQYITNPRKQRYVVKILKENVGRFDLHSTIMEQDSCNSQPALDGHANGLAVKKEDGLDLETTVCESRGQEVTETSQDDLCQDAQSKDLSAKDGMQTSVEEVENRTIREVRNPTRPKSKAKSTTKSDHKTQNGARVRGSKKTENRSTGTPDTKPKPARKRQRKNKEAEVDEFEGMSAEEIEYIQQKRKLKAEWEAAYASMDIKEEEMRDGSQVEIGDMIVLQQEDGVHYPAKVVRREQSETETGEPTSRAQVKFLGWRDSWNQWVTNLDKVYEYKGRETQLRKLNSITKRILQREKKWDKIKHRFVKKQKESLSDKGEAKQRVDDNVDFDLERPDAAKCITIPGNLERQMAFDLDRIECELLLPLPRMNTVHSILDVFFSSRAEAIALKAQAKAKAHGKASSSKSQIPDPATDKQVPLIDTKQSSSSSPVVNRSESSAPSGQDSEEVYTRVLEEETLRGEAEAAHICNIFDLMLPRELLYKFERLQYIKAFPQHVAKDHAEESRGLDNRPCQVYGAEMLLRMIWKLPFVAARGNKNDSTEFQETLIGSVRPIMTEIVKFLSDNNADLFVQDFLPADEDYMASWLDLQRLTHTDSVLSANSTAV